MPIVHIDIIKRPLRLLQVGKGCDGRNRRLARCGSRVCVRGHQRDGRRSICDLWRALCRPESEEEKVAKTQKPKQKPSALKESRPMIKKIEKQRVAVVTGGTRGIGAAISATLHALGYSVAATYMGNDKAAAELKAKTGVAVFSSTWRIMTAAPRTSPRSKRSLDPLIFSSTMPALRATVSCTR